MKNDSESSQKITFVTATKYHIILSYILRHSFPRDYKKCLVINDAMRDASITYERIRRLDSWDEVILLKNEKLGDISKGGYLKRIIKLFQFKSDIEKLIKNKNMKEICLFTHGDDCSNFFARSKYPSEIYLGEDGTFPYAGGIEMYDNFKTLSSMMEHTSNQKYGLSKSFKYIINGIKYLVKKLFFNFLIVDQGNRVNTILLMRPDLYNHRFDRSKHKILKAMNNEHIIANSFEELSKVFDYKKSDIYKDADVIFFDSGMIGSNVCSPEEEVEFTMQLLSSFKDKNILIKLSPWGYVEKNNLYRKMCQEENNVFIDDSSDEMPWEIIFYNNKDFLKNIVISSHRSSVCFSTYLIFNIEIDVVCFSNVVLEKFKFSEEGKITTNLSVEFLERIRGSYLQKSIYIPTSLSELNVANQNEDV